MLLWHLSTSLWETIKVASFQPHPPATLSAGKSLLRSNARYSGTKVPGGRQTILLVTVEAGLMNRGKSASSEIQHGKMC